MRARELTATVSGVELEKSLTSHFEESELSVNVDFPDVTDKKNRYDIITMFHVLEHLNDPKKMLKKLATLLSHAGPIIIEVPNAEDALLTLYNSKAFSEFTYWSCHLYLFTMRTLEMLFSQVELKVNYITQVQRYPLTNHLYWLAKKKPGGHKCWNFIDSSELSAAYENRLAAMGKSDTIISSVCNYQ